MNYRNLTPEEKVQFAENVATLLGGTDLSAIDAAVRTDLLTAMGTLPADLDAADAEAFVAAAQSKASTEARNAAADQVDTVLKSVRDYLIAGNAPKEQFDLCAFDIPATTKTVVVAQTPTTLGVLGYSNHVNKGKFTGNNTPGSVVYEVHRREGDEGPWGLRLQTKKQTFSDVDVTPGQYYEYKVRAVAAKNVSEFSNSAVVYGL